MTRMAPYRIRTFGDPVLRRRAEEVTDIDGRIARLVEEMHVMMKEANGVGLAAPQIGVSKRLFVYEIGDSGPRAVINPVLEGAEGEWEHEEGCLSVPGLWFNIARAKRAAVRGYDVNGEEVAYEGEEMEAKLFQHEVDHLDGKLLLERLDDEQRREAMRELRRRAEAGPVDRAGPPQTGPPQTGPPQTGPPQAGPGKDGPGPGKAGT
jgi:peptide deformylase